MIAIGTLTIVGVHAEITRNSGEAAAMDNHFAGTRKKGHSGQEDEVARLLRLVWSLAG